MGAPLNRGQLIGLKVYAVAAPVSAVAFWLWAAVTGEWDATVELPRGRDVMYVASFLDQFLVSGVAGLLGGLPFAAAWVMIDIGTRHAGGQPPAPDRPPQRHPLPPG
jgi:hypothetical protein